MPNPALPAVTSRSAWLALEPIEMIRPYYRATPPSPCPKLRASALPIASDAAAVGQRPRHRQARSAVAGVGVEIDVSVIDERAGRRHRGAVFEIERRPAPIEASPVRALFDPSAVLSSMKASFPLRRNCALAARLVICPLANSIALSPARARDIAAQDSRCAEPRAAPVTSRSAWLALEPVRKIEPVLSSDAAVTLSDAERVALPMVRCAAVGQRPRHRQARSAVAGVGVEIDVPSLASAPVVDTAAPLWRSKMPGADRSEPRQGAVRPQRRAVLDEGVVSVQVQMRAIGQAGDLPARELDRAVAGEIEHCRSRRPRRRTRAAGHVEERLVGAGAGQMDRARIVERRRRHLVRRRERVLPMARVPLLVSAPARVRLDPPSPASASRRMCPSLTSAPVVDTAASSWSANEAPAPIEASPVRALFDPSAVLSSMKASLPFRRKCAPSARLVICPLANSIALSPASRT